MLAENISNDLIINDTVVFLKIIPEINDFTQPKDVILTICSKNINYDINLSKLERSNLTTVRLLERLLKNKTVITWDIKKLITYILFHFKYHFKITNVIDLKYAEYFLDVKQSAPNSFIEAMQRALPVIRNEAFCKLNKSLYAPLSLEILPEIEIKKIQLNEGIEIKSYNINYDLVGHKNSRLICSQPSHRFLNVHGLTEETRSKIICPPNHIFLEFDYNHMEVNVLQWLSKDSKLLEIIKSGKDLYEEIYFIVFNKRCETIEERKLIKRIFLPYFFGLQAKTLSQELNIHYNDAQEMLNKIQSNFSIACNWINEQSHNGLIAKDYFGKIRDFTQESAYKSRNFYIQSPSATICLLKFIDLYAELNKYILFHIHDAYILCCHISEIKNVIKNTKNILESGIKIDNDDIYLKISCAVGNNLATLKKYPI